MQSEVTELPESPRCPILKALYLHRNCKLRTIPISFFEYMPALQVLNFSRTRIKTLPDSLFRLCYLKRLFRNHCELLTFLSPKIGELKQLEVLDLHGTEILKLPNEVGQLTNLTCLELSFYSDSNSEGDKGKSNALIPEGTISALSQLEELSIDVDPENERWERAVGASVNDIRGLKMLNTAKLYFPYVEHLMNFNWYSTPIERFEFTVGRHAKRIMSRFPQDLQYELEQWDRCLKYMNGVGIPFDIKKVLQHSTAFFLDRHVTAPKLSEFGIGNMQQLKCCIIGECNEIDYVLDGCDFSEEESSSEILSEYSFDGHSLGSLEFFHIYYMKSLRGIFTGPYTKCTQNARVISNA
ncbi:disease resistance protein At4g27190-like [Punica granatum]|uniref:Disease resistance protein At4g27190-like n=1 Tax=Punica granatum TaxID=22663 RepID=A0A6P8DDN1_PUNGR|nr:disease resistance protein At4g27190-like [Punica granatum]